MYVLSSVDTACRERRTDNKRAQRKRTSNACVVHENVGLRAVTCDEAVSLVVGEPICKHRHRLDQITTSKLLHCKTHPIDIPMIYHL